MLVNITSIICFTSLAIRFNKWWIVLFAAFFFITYRSESKMPEDEEDNNIGIDEKDSKDNWLK